MAIKKITVDSQSYDINDARINSLPLPISQGGTGATTDTAARTNLGLGTAATHAHGDYALAGHTHNYSKVTVTQTQTSGTEVGKITIDGTTTPLYAPEDTDTKVTQTVTTDSGHYKILATGVSNATSTTTTTAVFSSNIQINPGLNNISILGAGTSSGLVLVDEGGGIVGSFKYGTRGTTSVHGITNLQLGSDIPDGAIGSAKGQIYLFGTDGGYSSIESATANEYHSNKIPSENGYLAVGATAGVGNEYSPVYMTDYGVLTKCDNYKLALKNGTPVTQTLEIGTYLIIVNRTGTSGATYDGVWLLTAGTSANYSHMVQIVKGDNAITPTYDGSTQKITATGNSGYGSYGQLIIRRIG